MYNQEMTDRDTRSFVKQTKSSNPFLFTSAMLMRLLSYRLFFQCNDKCASVLQWVVTLAQQDGYGFYCRDWKWVRTGVLPQSKHAWGNEIGITELAVGGSKSGTNQELVQTVTPLLPNERWDNFRHLSILLLQLQQKPLLKPK